MKMASFSKMNNISHIDKQKSSEIWAFDPVHTLLVMLSVILITSANLPTFALIILEIVWE